MHTRTPATSITTPATQHSPHGFEFVSVDVQELAVRIKHMPIIDYTRGKVLRQESERSTRNKDRWVVVVMIMMMMCRHAQP